MNSWQENSATDGPFLWALGISMLLHGVFAVKDLSLDRYKRSPRQEARIEIVYDYEIAEKDSRLRQSVRRLSSAVDSLSSGGERVPLRVQMPERPSLIGEKLVDALAVPSAQAIDLSNLDESAGGDPVLLSYFSVIQKKIQRTASKRHWSKQVPQAGLVYVSFILLADGNVAAIDVTGVSGSPDAFRRVAVAIVGASAPFPPFPQTMAASQQLVTFPLEFL